MVTSPSAFRLTSLGTCVVGEIKGEVDRSSFRVAVEEDVWRKADVLAVKAPLEFVVTSTMAEIVSTDPPDWTCGKVMVYLAHLSQPVSNRCPSPVFEYLPDDTSCDIDDCS